MKHSHPIQISIPKPCSEDWDKMTQQEQGRFCDSCQKCVVDLTNFSDGELYQYLLENKGTKACGRFRPGQLNRPIQIPHQPHSQLYKWIIAAGLSLVFTIASEADVFAQAPIKQKTTITNSNSSTSSQHKHKDSVVLEELTIIEYKAPLMGVEWATPYCDTTVPGSMTFMTGEVQVELMQPSGKHSIDSVMNNFKPVPAKQRK
ncbi:MAG TPA: hypothetical protein VIN07_12490 [Flavipsychrobacter sp.]